MNGWDIRDENLSLLPDGGAALRRSAALQMYGRFHVKTVINTRKARIIGNLKPLLD
jgi:hypothetical protein